MLVVEDLDLPCKEDLSHILVENSFAVSEPFSEEIWTLVFEVTCWSISGQFHLVLFL